MTGYLFSFPAPTRLCPCGEPIPSDSVLCGECGKRVGMNAAAGARAGLLGLCREVAASVGDDGRDVTIETVLSEASKRFDVPVSHISELLGNAAGSMFKGGGWVFTGRRVRAKLKPESHARELKVWRRSE